MWDRQTPRLLGYILIIHTPPPVDNPDIQLVLLKIFQSYACMCYDRAWNFTDGTKVCFHLPFEAWLAYHQGLSFVFSEKNTTTNIKLQNIVIYSQNLFQW